MGLRSPGAGRGAGRSAALERARQSVGIGAESAGDERRQRHLEDAPGLRSPGLAGVGRRPEPVRRATGRAGPVLATAEQSTRAAGLPGTAGGARSVAPGSRATRRLSGRQGRWRCRTGTGRAAAWRRRGDAVPHRTPATTGLPRRRTGPGAAAGTARRRCRCLAGRVGQARVAGRCLRQGLAGARHGSAASAGRWRGRQWHCRGGCR
ncbi:general secretion pathway protein L [Pseudomonas aeruginosa]|nr:general secretion pathway protein L [Pseudomonas aeruginosa]